MKNGFCRVGLATLMFGASLVCSQQGVRAQSLPTSYTVIDVGRLPNMDGSYPLAINADDPANVKIVGTGVQAGYKKHAYYWSQSTGLRDIGVLGVGSYSEANSVNRFGEVAGQSATTTTGANNHAIYWNSGHGTAPLDLAPGWNLSVAYSINDSGVIAGYVYSQATGRLPAYWAPTSPGVYGGPQLLPGFPGAAINSSGPRAGKFINPTSDIIGNIPDANGNLIPVLWKNQGTPASPMYGDPVVISGPAGYPMSGAATMTTAVQADGTTRILVAGSWVDGAGNGRGCVWAEGDATATDIGGLDASNTSAPQIWGLNDLGQVSGHATVPTSSGSQFRAMAWAPGGSMVNLGTLGGTQSRAYGAHFNGLGYTINHAGHVVGHSTTAGNKATHAFRWSSAVGMQDLNSTTLTPSKGAFSYLQDAACIADSGIIAGSGVLSKGGGYLDTYLLLPR